ncbi:MAG: hypothetical protein ACLSBD_07495 [Blautia massiliensis (ex Durand et al. 2017)]
MLIHDSGCWADRSKAAMDLARKSFYIRMPGRWVSDGMYLFIKMCFHEEEE